MINEGNSDAEDRAPWEQAIDWAGVRAAITSGATIKQVHAEQAPEVSYTMFRRRLHRRATPPPAADQFGVCLHTRTVWGVRM